MFRLAKKCQSIGCILVLDEAYYLFGSQLRKNFKKFNNIIILRTFSKAFGLPSIWTGIQFPTKNDESTF